MHILLDKFQQDVKYTAHIASHQVELRREKKFTDQKYLFISSRQNGYLNLDNSSGSAGKNERENLAQEKCTFCGGTNQPTDNFSG